MKDRQFEADISELTPEEATKWAWMHGMAGTEPSPLRGDDGTPCAMVLRGAGADGTTWRLIYPLPGQDREILLITAPPAECTYKGDGAAS
jgi:hypothetical protein